MERVRCASGTGSFEVSREGGRIVSLVPGPGIPDLLHSEPVSDALGGDRAWLSPELDLFYEDPTDLDSRVHPEELDPGTWALDRSADVLNLQQRFKGAEMSRKIVPLEVPIAPTSSSWAGYRVVDKAVTEQRWSAWHIVMVPSPADIYVAAGDAVAYYSPAPEIKDGWIRSEDGPPRWKLGFHAPKNGSVFLAAVGDSDPGPVVILAADLPAEGNYVDRPPGGNVGTAAQVYSSGGDGFCELEVHAPLESRSVESFVMGAWGTRDERLRLIETIAVDQGGGR